MPVRQLYVDLVQLGYAEEAIRGVVGLFQHSSFTDGFETAPTYRQEIKFNSDASVYSFPLMPSDTDNLYEIVLYSKRGELCRLFFSMPNNDAYLHQIDTYTTPNKGVVLIRKRFTDLEDTPNQNIEGAYLVSRNGRLVFASTIAANDIELAGSLLQQTLNEKANAQAVVQSLSALGQVLQQIQDVLLNKASTNAVNNLQEQLDGKVTKDYVDYKYPAVSEMLNDIQQNFDLVEQKYGQDVNTLTNQVTQAITNTLPNSYIKKAFPNEALLKAFTPSELNYYAKDFDSGKIWFWDGSWHDTGLSDLDKAKSYTDLIENLKSSGDNLLNYLLKSTGFSLNIANNGQMTASANWTTTDFVNVSYNDIIQFNAASRSGVSCIAIYDLNKNFLGTLFEQTGSTVVDNILKTIQIVNKSAAYARFCYYHNTVNTIPHFKFVRSKITDTRINTKRISDEIFNRNNLINSSNIMAGYLISKNVQSVNAGWNCTDYIAVNELTNYVSNASAVFGTSTNDGLGVHFYDASKNFLGVGVRQTYNSSFNTPRNCAYIRMNFFLKPEFANLYQGGSLDYTKVLTETIDVDAVTATILNKDGSVTAGTSFINWKTTDYIDVSNIASLKYVLPALANVCSIVEYDENKAIVKVGLQSESSTLETLSGILVLNSATRYIKTCYYFPSGIYFIESNKYITKTLANEIKALGNDSFLVNDLSKKTWIALGDSITDHHTRPYTYSPIVAKQLNLNLLDGAYSGRRIRNAFIRTDIVTNDAILKANIITIAHGTNDFKLETSLGNITDVPTLSSLFFDSAYTSTSNTVDGTFYADYKGVIDYIYSINPSVRIMLITPIRRTQGSNNGTDTNNKGHKLLDYVNAIKQIADYYALPILDNYNYSGFSIKTIPTLTTDGLHPTEWAHRNIMAPKIARFISTH